MITSNTLPGPSDGTNLTLKDIKRAYESIQGLQPTIKYIYSRGVDCTETEEVYMIDTKYFSSYHHPEADYYVVLPTPEDIGYNELDKR